MGGNLDSDGSCGLTLPQSKPHQNPLLGPLANNGGPTQTMALLSGSPAIGLGVSAICNATPLSGLDQRGDPRPAACDSGAFQTQPAPATITYGTAPGPSASCSASPPR